MGIIAVVDVIVARTGVDCGIFSIITVGYGIVAVAAENGNVFAVTCNGVVARRAVYGYFVADIIERVIAGGAAHYAPIVPNADFSCRISQPNLRPLILYGIFEDNGAVPDAYNEIVAADRGRVTAADYLQGVISAEALD